VPKRPQRRSDPVRRLALEVCLAVLEQGESLGRVLEQRLAGLDDARDRAFCRELCFGFCRYYFILDAALGRMTKKPFKNKDRDIAVLVMLGFYQIRFMRVSDHAAVNETVGLLDALRKGWAKGLVNALLRGYLRAMPRDSSAELSADEHWRAYPEWIRKRVTDDWSENAATVLAAANRHAPMVLRIDNRRLTREDYLRQLADLGIPGREHAAVESAVVLDQACAVNSLPGFDQGLVSVQDAAAQLAASLLDCQPGMRVLDACAAPGGKTLHLLQHSDNLEVVALDKDAQRLQRVGENLARAQCLARLVAADAAEVDSWYDGLAFDRILLDAPCSASGIIRRHPDIRLLRRASDIPSLVAQQRRLLGKLWPLLKSGGLMLYCTCSIFRDENERQIEEFLQATPDCVEVPVDARHWGRSAGVGRQILPGFDDMDGFFYACLRKRA